eukprot:CAMPEP_0205961912 /NCGR_PEP_ID=MMETSP1459-20131121/69709_1 /ASSEMBLY_ACC=CAM_ASM_001120 /TAXON_ID=41880 /ORGANISM="Pycnococcus provasolii, Strain RCC931" /LENGTH=56 /DNA_ID=CAMNT_0053334669 /DNA_START=62 /DNA_END=229 /DNA_ORIENTATION=+
MPLSSPADVPRIAAIASFRLAGFQAARIIVRLLEPPPPPDALPMTVANDDAALGRS